MFFLFHKHLLGDFQVIITGQTAVLDTVTHILQELDKGNDSKQEPEHLSRTSDNHN
jgi:hypothetical protein